MSRPKKARAFLSLSLIAAIAICSFAALAEACSGEGGGGGCTEPSVIAEPPTGIGQHGAFAEFLVSPHGCVTSWEVKYGTTSPGNTLWSSGVLSSSTTSEPVYVTFTGLPSNTQYYYRLVATNSAGSGEASRSFKTLP